MASVPTAHNLISAMWIKYDFAERKAALWPQIKRNIGVRTKFLLRRFC